MHYRYCLAVLVAIICSGCATVEPATPTLETQSEPTIIFTSTPTNTPSPTFTASPSPTITPTPLGVGTVYFAFGQDIYAIDLMSGQVKEIGIARGDYIIGFGVSPDGKFMGVAGVELSNSTSESTPWTVRIISSENGEIINTLAGTAFGSYGPENLRPVVGWSPNREHSFFLNTLGNSEVPYTGELYLINAESEDKQLIAENIGSFTWSPDGTMIAYEEDKGSGVRRLYVRDIENSDDPTLLAEGIASFRYGMKWSSDGAQILFIDNYSYLYAIDLKGSSKQRLIENRVGEMSWSPDSSHIAASYGVVNDGCGILVFERDGTDPRTIVQVDRPLCVYDPIWSPDGNFLIYSQTDQERYSTTTRIVEKDGTRDELLAEESINYLVWSPDGKRLAVKLGGQLYSIAVDNLDDRILLYDSGYPNLYPFDFIGWAP
jgi:Tol biopolymer transport system component